MKIISIVAGAAIALAATIGSASAGEVFATIEDAHAVPMIAAEMDRVRGAAITLNAPAGAAFTTARQAIINGILGEAGALAGDPVTRTVPN